MPGQDAECRASGCHTLSPLNEQRKDFSGPRLVKETGFSSFSQCCCHSCQLLTYQISMLGVYSFDPMAHTSGKMFSVARNRELLFS